MFAARSYPPRGGQSKRCCCPVGSQAVRVTRLCGVYCPWDTEAGMEGRPRGGVGGGLGPASGFRGARAGLRCEGSLGGGEGQPRGVEGRLEGAAVEIRSLDFEEPVVHLRREVKCCS